MKKVASLIAGLGLLCSITTQAQNEVDALRYSQITFGGTARSTAMGGAFGSLGADFSTLSTNPAGLGVYRKSEFTITPSVFYQRTTSNYINSSGEDEKYNFNFNNWGFVLASKTGKNDDIPEWKFVNFAIGYNRYNNFNNRMFISGKGSPSSIVDTYLANAIGKTPDALDPFGSRLAFDTYLIDTVPGTVSSYFSDDFTGANHTQQKTLETTGGMGEVVLSLAGNYSDKVFVGGTIGLPAVRYSEEVLYQESDELNSIPYFNGMVLKQNLSTQGRGFNFKGGIIYKPFDFMRIGASLHTPTFFKLTDRYSADMNANFDNGNSYAATSPDGSFDYRLKTPMRASGSIGFILGKYGIISGEYEYVDYSTAKLRSSQYAFVGENGEVRSKYVATGNIKAGAEFKYESIAFRAGYALYGNPFKSGINNATRNNYTFGLGWRNDEYFVDFATVITKASENYYLYDPSITLVSPVKNNFSSSSFLLTVGYRF